MKKTRALLLTALLAGAASACDSNHLLVGNNPDGSSPGGGGAAGNGGSAGNGDPTTGGGAGSAMSFDAGQGSGSAGAGVADAAQGSGSAGATYGDQYTGVQTLKISLDDALTRITKVLWDSPPDAALISQYGQTQNLSTVVHQMLNDPRAASGVGAFYRWWLNLDGIAATAKDTTLFPAYTPSLQADMANETETFGVNVTLAMNGDFITLMTAPFSFINADLAAIYGASGVSGTDLRQVALDPIQRAGLLTQPGLQVLGSFSDRNSPSTRGMHVLRQILCQAVPAPPANTPPLATSAAGVTLRSALQTDTAAADCQACHASLDPPGVAFETFDSIGRFRTTDNGAPVDVSNLGMSFLIPGSQDVTTFSGPIQLAGDLALSATAQQCMTKQWLAFAMGTTQDTFKSDEWMPAYQAFANAKLNLKELIVAVLTSDTFLAPN